MIWADPTPTTNIERIENSNMLVFIINSLQLPIFLQQKRRIRIIWLQEFLVLELIPELQ